MGGKLTSCLLVLFILLLVVIGGCTKAEEEITLIIPGTAVELKMRLIPSGNFVMGTPEKEADRERNEVQHQVTITKSFYLSIYEVTQEQWKSVMGTNPSRFGNNAKFPVESVSWDDCQEFISKINTFGIGTFRFPTEAEWEYACRAGSTTRFYWGDDPDYKRLGEYSWYIENSNNSPHAVGQKKPNGWGLFDMHGNVWEWCNDWYNDYDSSTILQDPRGPSNGIYRIVRGNAWHGFPEYCRSGNRSIDLPTSTYDYYGFRLVRETQ